MSAELAVRSAVLAALRGDVALGDLVNGVFDGAQVQASAPFVQLAECSGAEWGGKGLDGREVRVALALRDLGESSGRIAEMIGRVDAVARGVAGVTSAGWRIVTVRFLRSRIGRASPAAGWQGVVDYRVRAVRDE